MCLVSLTTYCHIHIVLLLYGAWCGSILAVINLESLFGLGSTHERYVNDLFHSWISDASRIRRTMYSKIFLLSLFIHILIVLQCLSQHIIVVWVPLHCLLFT